MNNPSLITFIEVKNILLTTLINHVDFAFINCNYALNVNTDSSALATESKDSLAAQTFANGVVLHKGKEDIIKTLTLIQVLNFKKIKTYIKNTHALTVMSVVE